MFLLVSALFQCVLDFTGKCIVHLSSNIIFAKKQNTNEF